VQPTVPGFPGITAMSTPVLQLASLATTSSLLNEQKRIRGYKQ
jgi:hypothetical protein